MKNRLFLLAVALSACATPPPPVPAPTISVHRVSATFFVRPGGQAGRVTAADAVRLVEQLRRFGGGRLDAVHLVLPSAPAAAPLFGALVAAGMNPRKLAHDGPATPGASLPVFAARFVAEPPPCPPLDVVASGFGPNPSWPALGCTNLADLAAQVSDPADLLLNPAVPVPDPDRATAPITRLRVGPPR